MNAERESDPGEARSSSVLAEISRAMVGLYKEQLGRGPTRSRTDFAGPDIVVCTLEDTMTQAERRLAEIGDQQRLRETRLHLQHATQGQFNAAIERILERKVRAFISGIDTEGDVSAEVFYLEPA
jgi:uncharacterized protein YbcI